MVVRERARDISTVSKRTDNAGRELVVCVYTSGYNWGVRWGRRLQFRQGCIAHDSDKSKITTLHSL